jgi:hypothetical protein
VSGFSLEDASALLRLHGLYLDSFLVTDIKPLKVSVLSVFPCLRVSFAAGTAGSFVSIARRKSILCKWATDRT